MTREIVIFFSITKICIFHDNDFRHLSHNHEKAQDNFFDPHSFILLLL
jgi:hypothetical protein